MIGVAGMVAENLWKAGNDPDRMDNIYDLLDDPNCMSESDWRNAGLIHGAAITDNPTARIEAVIDLLSGPLWSELLRQARTAYHRVARQLYLQSAIVCGKGSGFRRHIAENLPQQGEQQFFAAHSGCGC